MQGPTTLHDLAQACFGFGGHVMVERDPLVGGMPNRVKETVSEAR
jgi:hypothetical protein